MATRKPMTWKRKQPSQRRAKHTVDCLLEAATQILIREGEGKLTTNKVAQRAGCSIGTLYQYFPNREAIQMEIILRENEALSHRLRAALAETPPSGEVDMVRQALRVLIAAFKERWRSRSMYALMMVQEVSAGGPQLPIGVVAKYVVDARNRSTYGSTHPLNESEVFVLTRAIKGVFQCALVEEASEIGGRSFEDAMVRLVMGFLRPGTSVAAA